MAGDMDLALVETQYVEGPNRILHGIAWMLRDEFGTDAGAWLDTPNTNMGSLSPRQFLRFDDEATWYFVWRMFAKPVDVSGIYPPGADPLAAMDR